MSNGTKLRHLKERNKEAVDNKKILLAMKPPTKEVSPRTLRNRAKRLRRKYS